MKKLRGARNMSLIDCRGLPCPTPVILIKKAIDESSGDIIHVILDNGASRENVIRFCKSRGCSILEETDLDQTTLTITPHPELKSVEESALSNRPPVLLIASDRLGNGSDELGRLLLKNFIVTLIEIPYKPEKIFFLNSGVLLTTEGSELLEPLQRLSDTGVELLSCGVCLDYYGLRDKLAAGVVSNMFTIAESLLLSGNSIKL
jgi:selenium metabolism protein YedF